MTLAKLISLNFYCLIPIWERAVKRLPRVLVMIKWINSLSWRGKWSALIGSCWHLWPVFLRRLESHGSLPLPQSLGPAVGVLETAASSLCFWAVSLGGHLLPHHRGLVEARLSINSPMPLLCKASESWFLGSPGSLLCIAQSLGSGGFGNFLSQPYAKCLISP